MSLWRRTPRQVYRVYGEDEYLSDEQVAADTEHHSNYHQFSDGQCSDSDKDRREFATAVPAARSPTPRLIGAGLLVGVTVGAAGLVLSHLSHEASPKRIAPASASTARHLSPASAETQPQASGPGSAHPAAQSRPSLPAGNRTSASIHRASDFAGGRGRGPAVMAHHPSGSRRAAPARIAGSNVSAGMATLSERERAWSSQAGSPVVSGGEFELERSAR